MAGLLRSLLRPVESKVVEFSSELMAALNGGWGLETKSGAKVSVTSALQVTAFYRAVLVIAEGVAQLPIEIYRRLPSGRGAEPAKDHPLYDLLLHEPFEGLDSMSFWRTSLMHAVATGNSVAYRNVLNGQLRELIPIRPESVAIDHHSVTMRPTFNITFEDGRGVLVSADEVFHLRGPSWSHYRGLDPSAIGREAIGLARATEEAHARLHKNGVRPSGTLTAPGKLDQADINQLREMWNEVYSGPENIAKAAVLANGLEWKSLRMTGVESEHLDTRKHQIEEIGRLVGVFPIMLGHAGDQTPTFASADAFFAAHERYSLQPWIKAVVAAVNVQLLTRQERAEGYFCRVDTSEWSRGSLKDRAEYYKAALGTNSSPGWLKPNEVREDDGWNPDDEADMDRVWQPATMAPVGSTPAAQPTPATGPEAKASAPRTLYVSRQLLNATEFLRWAREQGFKTPLAAADLHVTIAYSRTPIDWMEVGQAWTGDSGQIVVPPGGPRIVEAMGPDKGAAVALKFVSGELEWRHEQIMAAGGSHDFPSYQPHVTITYDPGDVDLASVQPFEGKLVFGPERFREIDASR